jgi:small conductance mechanosensitive channel
MEFDVAPVWAKVHAMIQGAVMALPNLLAALVVFALFVLVSKWVKQLIHRLSRRRGQHYNFSLAVGRVASAAIILLGLLVSLSVVLPSFRAADLIQVLGLGSMAVGFAFRDVLQNFLAGILILLAQPFRVGEAIAMDGVEGVVEEIQTRATLIKTWDGFLVVIPNATIYTQQITVFGREGCMNFSSAPAFSARSVRDSTDCARDFGHDHQRHPLKTRCGSGVQGSAVPSVARRRGRGSESRASGCHNP